MPVQGCTLPLPNSIAIPLLPNLGRTACTEPQCLYKGALYLYLTVELYLSPQSGPYGLYRASMPVQGCTLPYLYLTNTPLAHPAVWSAGPPLTVCVLSAFPAHGQCSGLAYLSFCDHYDPNVSSSLGHGLQAAVNLSFPHTTSNVLARTKVYGYSCLYTMVNSLKSKRMG